MVRTTGERLDELNREAYHFSTPTMTVEPDHGITIVYGDEEVIIDNAGVKEDSVRYGVTRKGTREVLRADIDPTLVYEENSTGSENYVRFSGLIHDEGYTRSAYVSGVYGGLRLDFTRSGGNVNLRIFSRELVTVRPSGNITDRLSQILPAKAMKSRRRGY